MNITIVNNPHNYFSNRELRKMVQFFIDELMPRYKQARMSIKVKFKPNLHLEKEKVHAYVHDKRMKSYILTVDSGLEKEEMVCSIAHELVHVKQYECDRFVYTHSGGSLKGVFCDVKTVDYYDWPWEAEAFTKQVELARLYLNK